MARTAQQIYDDMVAYAVQKATDQNNQDGIDLFSNMSNATMWGWVFWAIAFVASVSEQLWDAYQAIVNTNIANQFPHTLKWYRTKALAFEYGYNLIADTDKYDNSQLTDDQVAASLVVKYAACNKTIVDNKRVLLMKVAGTNTAGVLQPLADQQFISFQAYMEEVQDAGDDIIYYNQQADSLRANIDVYYNPLLLDVNGFSLLDGSEPVRDAANVYLAGNNTNNFNGEFSQAQFIDALQVAYGVDDKDIFLNSMLRLVDGNWVNAPNTFIPAAGYVAFATDGLIFNYIPHVAS